HKRRRKIMALIPSKVPAGIAAIILACGTLASSAASAETIDFSGLPIGQGVGTYDQFFPSSQTAFIVFSQAGVAFVGSNHVGNIRTDAPSQVTPPYLVANTPGSHEVFVEQLSGEPFNFFSVDLACRNLPNSPCTTTDIHVGDVLTGRTGQFAQTIFNEH